MKIIKILWVLVFALLVAAVIYEFTKEPVACSHDYSYNSSGKLQCEYCGDIVTSCPHNSVYCDAENKVCETCGQEREVIHDTYIVKCSVSKCRKCDYSKILTEKRHAIGQWELIDRQTCEFGIICSSCKEVYQTRYHRMRKIIRDCKWVEVCAECGITGEVISEYHNWVNTECILAGCCADCGKVNPQAKETHQYNNAFLRMFGVCTKCGQWQYESRKFDWLSRVAEVLAVALIAFAFQYVVRRRKYMHISWLTVIFMWLTENSCFGSFSPAVLWKKKLE